MRNTIEASFKRPKTMPVQSIAFTPGPAVKGREKEYKTVNVAVRPVLESWKASLFSFEWLTPDGALRDMDDLPIPQREKRLAVEDKMKNGEELPYPVLGIGLMDNVEIGSGKDVFLTLAANGHESISVCIPPPAKRNFRPIFPRNVIVQ